VLRKMFIKLFNKSYIYASNLLAGALVLFIKKLKKGLYFFIDYKTLNIIIRLNCYLLLLIKKTLINLIKVY
jgi:hypothetical protein